MTGLLLRTCADRDGGSWYFMSAVDVELPTTLGASNKVRGGACDAARDCTRDVARDGAWDGAYEEWWDGAWLGTWDGACDGLERAVKEWIDRGVGGRSSSRRSW